MRQPISDDNDDGDEETIHDIVQPSRSEPILPFAPTYTSTPNDPEDTHFQFPHISAENQAVRVARISRIEDLGRFPDLVMRPNMEYYRKKIEHYVPKIVGKEYRRPPWRRRSFEINCLRQNVRFMRNEDYAHHVETEHGNVLRVNLCRVYKKIFLSKPLQKRHEKSKHNFDGP